MGWGQGYKFEKTYTFAWFGKRSIVFSAGVLKGQRPGAGNMLVDYVRVWQ